VTYHRGDGTSDMGVLPLAQAFVNRTPEPQPYRVPPGMQLVPLQPLQSAPLQRQPGPDLKQLLLVVVVVIAILVLMYWLDKMSNQQPARPVRPNTRKQSTAEMARNLYNRLEKRGGVATTTMRSLKQLGRR
jgi:hypothetical protein